jgi:hypothetical protein
MSNVAWGRFRACGLFPAELTSLAVEATWFVEVCIASICIASAGSSFTVLYVQLGAGHWSSIFKFSSILFTAPSRVLQDDVY